MPIPPDSVVSTAINMAILSRPAIQGVDGPALDALCDAIAEVITATIKDGTVTVEPGIPVTTAGTALAQTGATIAPGIGTIS